MRTLTQYAMAVTLGLAFVGATPAGENEAEKKETKDAIRKGLDWLAKQQCADGHWEGHGGEYPATASALSGMALLMEGSTVRDGKYQDKVRKAVDWFIGRSQPNGMLGDPKKQQEAARYIYGHGYGMLFLAQVYGEEADKDLREKLEKVLNKAVDFSCKAQTKGGGWGYVSATDGHDFDEGSTTATQLQGLRAARNAGIVVPKEAIDKAVKYLEQCTAADGGLRYQLRQQGGGGLPAITAAGTVCGYSAGEYDSEFPKKWIKFCQQRIAIGGAGARAGHDEYMQYYWAQTVYSLGEDRYSKMVDKNAKEGTLTWSKYRDATYPMLVKCQQGDGSWTGFGHGTMIGPIYATAVNLTILQLENNPLPIYQR